MQSDRHSDGSGQDIAESTDVSKFGQDDVAAEGAGLDPHSPPDAPLGAEDPSIVEQGVIARDDVETRDERMEPEADGE